MAAPRIPASGPCHEKIIIRLILEAFTLKDIAKPLGATVEVALRAFLNTDLDLYIQGGEGWKNYGALGAQSSNTPYGAELFDYHFDPLVLRLIGILEKALPDCSL